MMSLLGASISAESFLMVLIAVILIVYFVYKEWPEFKKRMSGSAKQEALSETESKSIDKRVSSLEVAISSVESHTENLEKVQKENSDKLSHLSEALEKINDMLSRDYIRLNTAEKLARANADAINDSLEERRIIMHALLACLIGLQQVGANGQTGEAVMMINDYLNKQAHINQEIRHDASLPKLNHNL